ncbi:DNA ligase [Burkholderia ubonensis]|uniref:DNA ligase n=1 Tax=Burkholderia ubonensis TaxID=101571 RepID=A0A106QDY1_9BURK|nr:RNA ligase family protein [Burkholderia ubonensis]KWA84354.1 DNA ligase [Burkholderia ubonensis]
MESILKYPRTPHLEGSRLQEGDDASTQVPYSHLKGKYIVVEEKMDGANSGIRFNQDLALMLQSRGHYLTGGGREKHFNLLKSWAAYREDNLFDILGQKYLMYGEWCHSKHTVFYDHLPHYFLEFDILDTDSGAFLATARRRELIGSAPVAQVPVLYEGIAPRHLKDLLAMIKPSLGKTERWLESLRAVAQRQAIDVERAVAETEGSVLAEGLYIKVEENGVVTERYKWVRRDFLQTLLESDSHWLSRPIIPNQLAAGVDLFDDTIKPWGVGAMLPA